MAKHRPNERSTSCSAASCRASGGCRARGGTPRRDKANGGKPAKRSRLKKSRLITKSTKSGRRSRGAGFAIAPLADIIFSLAVIVVVLVAHQIASEELTRKSSFSGCQSEGLVAYAAGNYLYAPVMGIFEGPIQRISNAMIEALEAFSTALEAVGNNLLLFGVILLSAAIVLSALTLGTGTILFIPIGFLTIFGLLSGGFTGPGYDAIELSQSIDVLVLDLENNFGAFLGDGAAINAAQVGACQSGIVLRHSAPDLSIALAEEIDMCLDRGRDSDGFYLCKDFIAIEAPDECEVYASEGRGFEVTDECSVTFMLSTFMHWGSGYRSNSKYECGELECCAEHGTVIDDSGSPISTAQIGENTLIWDSDLCNDGKIGQEEDCVIELFYMAGKVQMRGVS